MSMPDTIPESAQKAKTPIMTWTSLGLCMRGVCEPPRDINTKHEKGAGTGVLAMDKDVRADYMVRGLLGKGGFSLVKEGIHRRTKERVALKFIDREYLSEREERQVIMEAGILTGLSHANLVKMKGFYKWHDGYCLALEHMPGGELYEDITRRLFYSEACARRIILQVLDALVFLHRRGIVHRDLKPENLLLPKIGSDQIKVADFGLATVLTPPTYKVVEPVGTPGYAAPELLRLVPYDGQVDVFSLGVISFVLLAGYLPFAGDSVTKVVKATIIGKPSYDDVRWEATSPEAKAFVERLLSPDPAVRPTADSAMFHPWMKARSKQLQTRALSDRRSGVAKSLLADFQTEQKLRMKAAVSVVLAKNRFQKALSSRTADTDGDTDNGEASTDTIETTDEDDVAAAAPAVAVSTTA